MIEYTYDVQKLFLEMMMHDAQSFLRVQNIFNEETLGTSWVNCFLNAVISIIQ